MDKSQKIAKVFSGGENSTLVHLNEAQADKFIDYAVDQSVILKSARVIRMDTPQKTIGKIGISDKILYPAQRGQALDSSKRVSATPEKITLVTQEVIGEVRIYDDEIEDNIEGVAFKEHMMKMVAKKVANQLEKVSLYARKVANPTDLLHMFDGFVKEIETNGGVVVDANVGFSDRYIDKDKLAKLYKSIDDIFGDMINKWYMPKGVAIDYEVKYEATNNAVNRYGAFGIDFTKANLLSTKRPVLVGSGYTGTISADVTAGATTAVLTDETGLSVSDEITFNLGKDKEHTAIITAINAGTNTITFANHPIPFALDSSEASENTVKETVSDGADVILTPDFNFIYGIQRDITIEPDRVAKERATDFVITMRVDFKVENPEMSGILKNVKVR